MVSIVQSPCVRHCCLNEADICLGCFRSLEEITRWSLVDDVAKTEILTQAIERRSQPCAKPALGSDDNDN